MKKLFIITLFSLLALESKAQSLTIDSLTRFEIVLVRERFQSMFRDSAAFASDSLLTVVRGINTQLRNAPRARNVFSITVPYGVAKKYAETFANSISIIEGDEQRARETLRTIQFQKKILKAAYQAEQAAGVPDSMSMFKNWLLYSENRKTFLRLVR